MKALVSIGVNKHERYMEIARPSFKAFADLHGYDLYLINQIDNNRYPAWYKVPALMNLLQSYDEAVFIGSDCVIVDGREDFEVPEGYWQAMVKHKTGDGEVPNTDMWICRREMLPWLQKVWEGTHWLKHGWWEQAALMELMGYQVKQPAHLINPTELYERTHWLDNGWNVHIWDKPQPEHKRIQHATMHKDREKIMIEWAAQAEAEWMNVYQPA